MLLICYAISVGVLVYHLTCTKCCVYIPECIPVSTLAFSFTLTAPVGKLLGLQEPFFSVVDFIHYFLVPFELSVILPLSLCLSLSFSLAFWGV